MIKINRVKATVITQDGVYGFDQSFSKNINFIISDNNTKGKSSLVEAIYYGLGLEEILGGQGVKALRNVFKTDLIDSSNNKVVVLNTMFELELENSKGEIIQIERGTKESSLVKVELKNKTEYYYLNHAGSATKAKGFHKYLEEFIGIRLPEVMTYDGVDRKLYLQLVFSAIFIEQKRGWGDYLACIPRNFKVKEPKKRVIEYLLGLGTLNQEKKKEQLKAAQHNIQLVYKNKIKELEKIYEKNFIKGFEPKKNIVNQIKISKKHIVDKKELLYDLSIGKDKNQMNLDKYILMQEAYIEELNNKKVVIIDNIEILKLALLNKKEYLVKEMQNLTYLLNCKEELVRDRKSLEKYLLRLNQNLEQNKEAGKISKLTEGLDLKMNKGLCPVCMTHIDNEILLNKDFEVMSISQNILYLKEQKKLIEYNIKTLINALNENKIDIIKGEKEILILEEDINKITSDLFLPNGAISEAIIYEKIKIEEEIKELKNAKEEIKLLAIEIRDDLVKYYDIMQVINGLPKDNYSEEDNKILDNFKKTFNYNLNLYAYESIEASEFNKIEISKETLLPILNGLDLKFNSSASDTIRAIWAFTKSLVEVSAISNSIGIMIFDEPEQQNIITKDIITFIENLNELTNTQKIIALTIKDTMIHNVINKITDKKIINVEEYLVKNLKKDR